MSLRTTGPDSPALSFLWNETHGWCVIPLSFLEMVGPCTRAACVIYKDLFLATTKACVRHHQLPPPPFHQQSSPGRAASFRALMKSITTPTAYHHSRSLDRRRKPKYVDGVARHRTCDVMLCL